MDLLSELQKMGVIVCYLTLHVGLGTFRPVQVDDVTTHKMHSEFFVLPSSTAVILNQAKAEHRAIIAVGTTTTRTLETMMARYGTFIETSGWTDIFLYPGCEFRAIDGLITNFHLPKSTLIMLVSAFSSKATVMKAYEMAVEMKYRFFSFGDAMFFPPKRESLKSCRD
jgi:S-adenosylmethionine:tRNA ribosyltransferase-isomerase